MAGLQKWSAAGAGALRLEPSCSFRVFTGPPPPPNPPRIIWPKLGRTGAPPGPPMLMPAIGPVAVEALSQ
jgi:hypothetical protein